MEYFEKKQKIILGIVIAIVVGLIGYYVYGKEEQKTIQGEEESLWEPTETKEEEDNRDDKILVHISGAVQKEGIIELKRNSRIADAIEKAGGFREDAYVEEINLAYKLEDGMKIKILTKEEKQKQMEEKEKEEWITTNSGVVNNEEEEGNTKNSKININTATRESIRNFARNWYFYGYKNY